MTDRFDDAEPTQAASATAHPLDELHGHRPNAREPDPLPPSVPDPA